MSLTILYSDRIEDLAADLKERLKADKAAGGDPFKFTQVVVPNTNIAKWLQMRVFAKEDKLCAGIRFPFMEQRLTELMRVNLEHPEQFELLPDHAYAQAIMHVLLTENADAFKKFRAYIAGGSEAFPLQIENQKQARMAWQLADKLAGLMDQYEVRRPEIVESWLAGGSAKDAQTPPVGIEAAEAALAKALWGTEGIFPESGNRLSLRQLYERVKNSDPHSSAESENKIYFFGQSTLSLLQVRILVWLAKKYEVIAYYNNICLEYWGDIETKKERIKRLGREQSAKEDIAIDNPLLQQWGVAGRDTLRLLVDLEEENDGKVNFDWRKIGLERDSEGTVLKKVQGSIRHRTSELVRLKQDASIQVVGTPGIRREVEMVYNSILGSVWKPKNAGVRPWPDCSFSDIAVLVPDMKTYRPVIESVFDARGEVPYGLIDSSASEDSQYLAGFLALAELGRKGLNRETLFAVLENPCVQERLDFSRDDVRKWRELTGKELGAYNGFDRKNEKDFFNWDWALQRVRLSRVADSLSDAEGAVPLVKGGGDAVLKFSEVVETVWRETEDAFGIVRTGFAAMTGREWDYRLKTLANALLTVQKDDILESTVRKHLMRTLSALDDFEGEQNFEFAVAAVAQFVGGVACRKGGYLTHGVTIAGLQPMRPVPFRQVYVLGLGAGGFPGRTSKSTLDIRGTGWALGDVSGPNMNRYLFLETLMSVRDRLVLSYSNRDIEKDAELFPAGIVRELESFVGKYVLEGDMEFSEFKGYPLLERGEAEGTGRNPTANVVWTSDDPDAGILPTYSATARSIANERCFGTVANKVYNAPAAMERTEITAKELADFLRNPLRAVMQHRFGIAVEGYRDLELDPDAPLDVQGGPTLRNLQSRVFMVSVKAKREGVPPDDALSAVYRELQRSGGAPAGFLGDFAIDQVRAVLDENMAALVDFAKDYEITASDGECVRTGVMQARFAGSAPRGPFSKGEKDSPLPVLLVGTVENWKQEDAAESVLVVGSIGKKMPTLPPDCTLEAVLTFLIELSERTGDAARMLTVGVVDLGHGICGSWQWAVTPAKAKVLVEKLAGRYLDYLNRSEGKIGDDGFPVFDYWKTRDALENAHCPLEPDYDALVEALEAEGWDGGKKKRTFNRALVVEKALAPYGRLPTADELKEMYNDFYKVLLGEEHFVAAANGGIAQ